MSDIVSILIMGLAIFGPAMLCFIIARNENRNTRRWLIYGLFFGVFALIYLVFYAKEIDEDKIETRVMLLLGIFMIVSFIGLYHTFIGFYF